MPLRLGAIADDLTGATDLALTLARSGMSVRQTVGIPADPNAISGADAVVISLKSRTIPAAEAVTQSLDAAKVLLAAGAAQLFFKYCSTFDSTDAGNIGPVIDALLDLLAEDRTLACPAFPTNKRTVYKGHLFVGDQLLSDSPMKDHPLTPMRDANLVRVLGRQTARPVRLVDINAVRGEHLDHGLSDKPGIAIVDALDDADLLAIGRAAANMRLVTGGSGVAMGLPANWGISQRTNATRHQSPSGRTLVLAGSCSGATRQQISVAMAAGFDGLQLDPIEIAAGRQTISDALDFATKATATPVIYASATPEAVAKSQDALGRDRAGAVVEAFLSELAPLLVNRGFDQLIIAGGETSGAVVAGLGLKNLDIGPEIDPGVPWMYSKVGETPIAIALKSGNFGADNMFIKAWDLLR
ncbi:3-oxo-tetronate kinase [Paradevosia shaoguanensis]|uniref:3-oxo-tetronate kinase n=1 Tax=Paradevosia shaoguanensis TaxID=1335043 RepID=UPI00289C74ED